MSLSEARLLYRQGYLHPAWLHLETLPPDAETLLLRLRCQMALGDFRAAWQGCEEAITQVPAEWRPAFLLWQAVLALLRAEDGDLVQSQGRGLAEQVAPTSPVWPVAQEALARGLAMGVVLLQWPRPVLEEARTRLAQAAERYHTQGDPEAAWQSLLALGRLYRQPLAPNQEEARRLSQRVYEEASRADDPLYQARALLCLWEQKTQSNVSESPSDSTKPLEEIEALFHRANYVGGKAEVQQALARWRLLRGEDGRPEMQAACEQFQSLRYWADTQRCLIEGGHLATVAGDLEAAMRYYLQAEQVAHQMDCLGEKVTVWMGLGDLFFRRGRYAEAQSAYEQAIQNNKSPWLHALCLLQLASLYQMMARIPEAIPTAESAIRALQAQGAAPEISLAFYIHGNGLFMARRYADAIEAWQQGIVYDKTTGDDCSLAKKLQSIAQATALQHYRKGQPLPEAIYQQAQHSLEEAERLLHPLETGDARATLAANAGMQAQLALTNQHEPEALGYLAQAWQGYAALGWQMQKANTEALLGLLQGKIADSPADCAQAASWLWQAVAYYSASEMRELRWKAHLYLAYVMEHYGVLNQEAGTMRFWFRNALTHLEEAASDLEAQRKEFRASSPLETDAIKQALGGDKEDVFDFALQLSLRIEQTTEAFAWAERQRSRSLIEMLAQTPLPSALPAPFQEQEAPLLVALAKATEQREILDLSHQLTTLWRTASQVAPTEVQEYLSLRLGNPTTWSEVRFLLAEGESAFSRGGASKGGGA